MKENIQVGAEYLANLCLEQEQKFQDYSDKDLENATIIFSHILIDIIWRTNQDMFQEGRGKLAEATGMAIRELIRSSTGLDMHEVVKK
jgi:hypothetical protein